MHWVLSERGGGNLEIEYLNFYLVGGRNGRDPANTLTDKEAGIAHVSQERGLLGCFWVSHSVFVCAKGMIAKWSLRLTSWRSQSHLTRHCRFVKQFMFGRY